MRVDQGDAFKRFLCVWHVQCCNTTFCLCALLNLAGRCEKFTNPEDYQYGHLVTRCLQKFTNLISNVDSKAIDLPQIFHCFKRLFNDTWGTAEVQVRRTAGDRSFYMVARLLKTVREGERDRQRHKMVCVSSYLGSCYSPDVNRR